MPALESTALRVSGVHTEDDVRECLQELYDVFTEHGWGQATFEVDPDGGDATVWIKHRADAAVDPAVVDAAVRRAGDYAVTGTVHRPE